MARLAFATALLAVCCVMFVDAQTCVPVQAPVAPSAANPSGTVPSRCWLHLNYTVAINNSTPGPFPLTCLSDMETMVSTLDRMAPMISASCHAAVTKYMCRAVFPPCGYGNTADLFPATSVCQAVTSACNATDMGRISALYPGAAGLPSPLSYFPHTVTSGTTTFNFSLCVDPAGQTAPFNTIPAGVPVRAPKCELYGTGVAFAAGESLESSMCYPVVGGKNVYVRQSFISALGLTSQQPLFDQVKGVRFMSNVFPAATCAFSLIQFICQVAFPECDQQVFPAGPLGSLTFELPRFPPRALCQSIDAGCATGNPTLDFLLVSVRTSLGVNNCTGDFSLSPDTDIVKNDTGVCAYSAAVNAGATKIPRFPVTSYTIPGSITLTVNNSAELPSSQSAALKESAAVCPYPTVYSTDTVVTLGGACANPCPNFLWSNDEYDTIDEMAMVLTGLGLFCMILLCITFACFKKTRKKYNLYFTLNMVIVAQGLFFSVAAQHDGVRGIMPSMRCEDNAHGRLDGWCQWQSISMIFAGLSAAGWWFVQAVDLYLQMKWNSRKWSKEKTLKKDILYFLWGWAYPFLVCIIVVASSESGNPVQGGPWCLFLGDAIGWALFYSPIAAQCFFGAILMFVIIKQLYTSSVKMKTHKKKGHWRLYIKPLLFVGLFELVWLMVFVYRFDAQFRQDELKDTAVAFIRCQLAEKPGAALLFQNLVCPDPARPSIGLYFLISFFIFATGPLCFLLYYTQENFVMWYHWLTCKSYNFSKTSGSKTGSMSRSTSGGSSNSKSKQKKRIYRPNNQGHRKLLSGEDSKSSRSTKPDLVRASSKDVQSMRVDEDLPTNIAISYPPVAEEPESTAVPSVPDLPPEPEEGIEMLPTGEMNAVTGGRGSVMAAPSVEEKET